MVITAPPSVIEDLTVLIQDIRQEKPRSTIIPSLDIVDSIQSGNYFVVQAWLTNYKKSRNQALNDAIKQTRMLEPYTTRTCNHSVRSWKVVS